MFTSVGYCCGIIAFFITTELCNVILVRSEVIPFKQHPSVRWRRQIACRHKLERLPSKTVDVSQNSCSGRFKCESGQCIDFNKVCNGFPDCRDSSDETRTLCQPWNRKCPPRSFQCSYGACIKDDGICNGKVDCMDESDEKVEGCSTVSNAEGEDTTTKSPSPSTSVGSCIMPEKPVNGYILINDCVQGKNSSACNQAPGSAVSPTTLLTFSCAEGYQMKGHEEVVCYSGKWYPSTFPTCTAVRYDYKEVLQKSLLFYEAQRSGKLPPDQKVTWRKDSALNDKGENGEDLTGGYYDGPKYLKYGFPMAHTTTVLAWGLISYRKGYEAADALIDGRKAIKWATDYFLKAHVDNNTFYGQVGLTTLNHQYWGRPEDMTMERPAFKLDPDNPGSDLLGETAAALAASYIVFKTADPEYAEELLVHAKQLFNLANNHRGKYSDSIPDARESYGSEHYEDELVWAATWLYKATGDKMYLRKAEDMYEEFKLHDDEGFGWQAKHSGIFALLGNLTNSNRYKQKLRSYCDNLITEYKKTPKGLLYISKWGVLGLAAKASFICMQASDMGIRTEDYRKFVQKQIGYMLGDTGHSFVVGFGKDPPTHVHHASSSCPDAPAPCNWEVHGSSTPNAHVLYGALVGGPDENDTYVDIRSDYVHNQAMCDYNSGFQSVIAGLIQYSL